MTGDRYNVPSSPGADLEQRLRDLEQRVDAQFNRTLRHSILPEGSVTILNAAGGTRAILDAVGLRLYDDAGNLVLNLSGAGLSVLDNAGLTRVLLGLISAGNYGARVRDAANGIKLSVEGDGFKDPWLAHPWRKVITPDRESTASASFVDTWGSRIENIGHLGVVATVAWVTDPGTTAEIRLRRSTSNTSAVALAAGSSGAQQFRWLHGATLDTGPHDFLIQARVTGGAGSVHIDQPFGACEMADPDACSATGL